MLDSDAAARHASQVFRLIVFCRMTPPRFAVLALAALVLAACAASEPDLLLRNDRRDEAANVPPANPRGDILALMRTYLNDPSRIRDATVSEPVLKQFGSVRRYIVCLRYNARNLDGKYTGAKDRIAVFVGGKLDQVVEQPRDNCVGVEQKPFPELEQLTR